MATSSLTWPILARSGVCNREWLNYVGMPPTANANIAASVVNGSIRPDFPLTVTGVLSDKKINGKLNNGGPELSLKTVNGSIHLRRAGLI